MTVFSQCSALFWPLYTSEFFCHMQIYNRVEVGETLSVDTITAYLKKKFPKANAARILGVDSNYDDNRKVMLLQMPGKTAVATFSVKMSQFNLQRIIYKIISVHIACVIALVNIKCCLLNIPRHMDMRLYFKTQMSLSL